MPVLVHSWIHTLSPSPLILCLKPISQSSKPKIPARDRVIDFGKHRGKMLGSLPSSYLKWVSKNLRARDFEHWAKLSDQVLHDPVYKDRLEWEFAQKILNGDRSFRASNSTTNHSSSTFSEIAKDFGWDYKNKAAWSAVDFELLGTSKGVRIPRIPTSDDERLHLGGLEGDNDRKVEILGGAGEDLSAKPGDFYKKIGFLDSKMSLRSKNGGKLTSLGRKAAISEKDLGLRREERLLVLNSNSEVSRSKAFRSSNRISRLNNGGNLCFSDKKSRFQSGGEVEVETEKMRVGFLSKGARYYDLNESFEDEVVKERREERRERQRLKRRLEMEWLKREVVGVSKNEVLNQNQNRSFNPFPGREALLRKFAELAHYQHNMETWFFQANLCLCSSSFSLSSLRPYHVEKLDCFLYFIKEDTSAIQLNRMGKKWILPIPLH